MAVKEDIKSPLKNYPALSAALVDVALMVTAYFGLNIPADAMLAVVSAITVLLGALVHSNVEPLSKVEAAEDGK